MNLKMKIGKRGEKEQIVMKGQKLGSFQVLENGRVSSKYGEVYNSNGEKKKNIDNHKDQ